jgi:hypothetical protein
MVVPREVKSIAPSTGAANRREGLERCPEGSMSSAIPALLVVQNEIQVLMRRRLDDEDEGDGHGRLSDLPIAAPGREFLERKRVFDPLSTQTQIMFDI